MNWLHRLARPRLMAALAFAFALVPAWLAVVTYRDAREKDKRLFQTSAQVLGEQLQRAYESNTYFLGMVRGQASTLDDPALADGRMVPNIDWMAKLPHLLAFAYVEQADDRAIIRWKSEERIGLPKVGEDIAKLPAVATALAGGRGAGGDSKLEAPAPAAGGVASGTPNARIAGARTERMHDHHFPTRSILGPEGKTLLLLPLMRQNERALRGYVAGWVDTGAICRDTTIQLLRDGVLTARPLVSGEATPDGATRVEIQDSRAPWTVAIARGPRFNQEYGAPAPWLAFLAVGLSAVPLLVLAALAGHAGNLQAALAAEREVAERQKFFTQSVSHEFRTPLGVILSGADLLDRYAGQLTPERRAEVLAEIKDNTRQMTEMIESVLLLGRIESNKLTCTRERTNIAKLCRDIARKVTAAAPGTMNVSAPDQEAMLDAALLGSVIGNLLSNAVKYSPPGSPVDLSATVEKDRIIFTVRDQGAGIPAGELPRVCDPFHRCQNVGEVPGTGLGLAIALRCTELHGGSLKIESGPGTTATLSIPCA